MQQERKLATWFMHGSAAQSPLSGCCTAWRACAMQHLPSGGRCARPETRQTTSGFNMTIHVYQYTSFEQQRGGGS
jgi:hypothetical protein